MLLNINEMFQCNIQQHLSKASDFTFYLAASELGVFLYPTFGDKSHFNVLQRNYGEVIVTGEKSGNREK